MVRFLWRRFIADALSRSLVARLAPELEARMAAVFEANSKVMPSNIGPSAATSATLKAPGHVEAFRLPPHFKAVEIEDELGSSFVVIVNADQPNTYDRWVIETRHYSDIARLLRRLLRGKGTLIDLGANIGTVCLPVALAGNHVVAVELLPENTLRLALAARANDFPHFRVVQAAVSDEDSLVGYAGDEAWGHVVKPTGQALAVGMRLDTITTLVARENPTLVRPPIVMKVDIEGHEYEALLGAKKFLADYRPPFVFESILHAGDLPNGATKVKGLVDEHGYDMYMLRGRVLSKHSVNDLQIGLVSDILALPRESQGEWKRLLDDYEFRDLSPAEQVEWLNEMAHSGSAHQSHAAAMIPKLLDRLPEEHARLSEISKALALDNSRSGVTVTVR